MSLRCSVVWTLRWANATDDSNDECRMSNVELEVALAANVAVLTPTLAPALDLLRWPTDHQGERRRSRRRDVEEAGGIDTWTTHRARQQGFPDLEEDDVRLPAG